MNHDRADAQTMAALREAERRATEAAIRRTPPGPSHSSARVRNAAATLLWAGFTLRDGHSVRRAMSHGEAVTLDAREIERASLAKVAAEQKRQRKQRARLAAAVK